MSTMSPRIRKLFTFPIDDELAEGLREVEQREGVSKAEQIRRGIRLWLDSKGLEVPREKSERKRVLPRRRP